jgi:8-oxo-dGTP diphosphatase
VDSIVTTTILADRLDVVLDLDSVAAVLVRDGRFLLQHREDRPGISYPGEWSLFGGAREGSETAEQALRRELREELALDAPNCTLIMSCWYDLSFERRVTRKVFFGVKLENVHVDRLVLNEGQGMAWFDFEQILAAGSRIVPYDLAVLALYERICRKE